MGEPGAGQGGTGQVRTGQVGTGQVCTSQFGTCQVRTGQVKTSQAGQVSTGQNGRQVLLGTRAWPYSVLLVLPHFYDITSTLCDTTLIVLCCITCVIPHLGSIQGETKFPCA